MEAQANELASITRAEPNTVDPDLEIVDSWIEKLGLTHLLDQLKGPPQQISHGREVIGHPMPHRPECGALHEAAVGQPTGTEAPIPARPSAEAKTAGPSLWTGLIVLDSGTYLLMSLVLMGGLALQQASAVKAVLIGAATVVSLAVFIHSGQVAWGAALPLMLGSALGGWLGASLALGTNARLWIYRLLIAALALELGAMVLGWKHPAMHMMQI